MAEIEWVVDEQMNLLRAGIIEEVAQASPSEQAAKENLQKLLTALEYERTGILKGRISVSLHRRRENETVFA